jgi:Spy/CpxP family protein refolding chaperone
MMHTMVTRCLSVVVFSIGIAFWACPSPTAWCADDNASSSAESKPSDATNPAATTAEKSDASKDEKATAEPSATQKTKAGKETKKGIAGKKARGEGNRLPMHYAKVVTPEQRTKIYEIQDKYKSKIADAREALNQLIEKQHEEVSAVLTPEQKKQVEEAAAKSKKDPKDKHEASEKEAADASSATESTSPKE